MHEENVESDSDNSLESIFYFNIHKVRMLGLTDNATCRLCKGADETAEHILCKCDAISLKRLLYLEKANLTPEEIVSVPLDRCLTSLEV